MTNDSAPLVAASAAAGGGAPLGRALVYEKLRRGTFIIDELAARGVEADLPNGPDATLLRHARISEDALIELARGYTGVIGVSAARWTRRVFQALPELRSLSKIGIGHEVIDLEAAQEAGVRVTNTPAQVEIESVAEHAIALLLAAAKRLDFYDRRRMSEGGWIDGAVSSRLLTGRTLGLIGFGRIARQVVRRLEPWGMHIVAHDVSAVADHPGVRFVGLDELLASSDLVSLHAPGSPDGRPILDRERLARLRPGAIVVNTGRGGLIDSDALSDALASGRVGVAGLDVFEPEPPRASDPLFQNPNLLTTPHTAAAVDEAEEAMELMAVTNLVEMMRGSDPAALLTRPSAGPADV